MNFSSRTDTKNRFLAGTRANWLAPMPKAKAKPKPAVLKGWKDITHFLGQPSPTAQRWAREGMPVQREGRIVGAKPEKLNQWLGRVSHEPVQIATETPDLSAELRRGLAYVRSSGKRGGITRMSRSGKRL